MMDQAILQVLQHALGVDRYGCGEQYRDYFVAGPGHSDYATCRAAESAGLMTSYEIGSVVGGWVFCVTAAGRGYVKYHSPSPPKLTRAQRRYRAYLRHDSDLTFGDWLKAYGSRIA